MEPKTRSAAGGSGVVVASSRASWLGLGWCSGRIPAGSGATAVRSMEGGKDFCWQGVAAAG